MSLQTVFKRYELKYMLTTEQKERVLEGIVPYMQPDKYGRTTIRNLYFDTDTHLLIRRSIENPVYKEKFRMRSYCKADADSTVFAEIKRKYNHVVYKRRMPLSEAEAMKWLSGEKYIGKHTQISNEIDYFMKRYGTLHPTVFLSYEREAYYAKDGSSFRITFDNTILCREEELSLQADPYGIPILPEEKVLMEIKCAGGIPLWMTEMLSKERLYKTPFSKYGTAYKTLIFPKTHKINAYNRLEVTENA